MYFKQIELTGFKSFPDQTIIRLEPGITAIVGPNGCGKSNVLDALRWALGEQRPRELRGSHMHDVIFNGSENRHPLGMTEVSATFDNSDSRLPIDFAEVQITRRLYRSGESEYLINNAFCRLRDIQELFMDTGVGTHAYSMVGQGKMDLILSSRPEDRRYLFEEAAGIIKYKSRKRVALRKLELAEQNLLRLSDIIAEVQRQMRSLKRQANAARRYRELSEQLRELEIRAAWLTYVHLTAQVSESREKFAAAQAAHEQATAETSRLEARYEELGLDKLEADRILLARREGVHDIETEMEKVERQIALLRQQADFSREQLERAARERDAFKAQAQTIHSEIEETKQQAETIRSEIAACEADLRSKQSEHEQGSQRVEEATALLETMRRRALERMNDRAQATTEVETSGVAIDNIDGQLEGVYARQESENQRRDALEALLGEVRSAESEKRAALAELEAQRDQFRAERAAKSEALRTLDASWQTLREKRSSLAARLSSLRELRDTYEGFTAGVRAVMGAKNDAEAGLRGIVGPVGDLLSTPRKYERAIEAALGGNINNVVVEDAEAAQAAIAFLKERTAGRVTFLPLDIIRGGPGRKAGALHSHPGIVGTALDVVEYEPEIRNAVEYLLSNTLIIETLDDAIRIARAEQRFPRLVTLEGEVVSPGGSVTGGRTRHEGRGLLGRSAEIAELDEQVQATETELTGAAEEREALLQAIEEQNAALERVAGEEAALHGELNDMGVAMARHAAELENLAKSLEALENQRDALSARRGELEAERRGMLARVEDLESGDEALQVEMARAQDAASRARASLATCADALADVRVNHAALTQRLDEVARNEERQQREHDEAKQKESSRTEQVNELTGKRASIENDVAAHIERQKALALESEEARSKVVAAENQRQTLLDESETIEGKLRELRERMRETQSAVHQIEMSLRHDEDRISFFHERMMSEYSVGLDTLAEDAVGTDDYDAETRDQMVADLRARLQRMGEVNLMAIEEYENLEQRNAFLVSQAEDLQKARETLLHVVARSDKKTRELFMDTFVKVSENFRTYFRSLFNGGQARIYLLDEDDPLESGIEVEARPPGKKPQSISLLSGGESALTSIALLFSIFKAKPTPFCVLDEVDAPLDDANIGRFVSLLEEFSDESQFVVITHNKQTMARADILYGVTMQERGVSQLVSVKFDEVDRAESAA